ncbi:MAG: LON peptidase substrate-binding domain-containing protein [Pseudomonadota bacterium]|nr:LON peptidase substrate-binding domain-containing protein [Pseudomonadota bacterium]
MQLYRKPEDLPAEIPVFPLRGVILLPRSTLPLNVFEPRYIALINDALAGSRLVGIVQPDTSAGEEESPAGSTVPLRSIGSVGRITAFQETDDGRILVTLTGVARYRIMSERGSTAPYRVCKVDFTPYAADFEQGAGESAVNRKRLLRVLRNYLQAHDLNADWDSINRSSNELLVNTLSVISPYGPEEKQALLEAIDLKARSEVLIALAEMDLAARDGGAGGTVQ